MNYLRAACNYITYPVTRVVEKTVEVPVRASGGANAKLAAVFGATAIAALSYCAHGFRQGTSDEKRIRTFKNGADIHILHSIALLGSCISRYPELTMTLLATGTVLFSGTCYYTAITQDTRFVHAAPVGGITLILAWLSFAL